VTEIASVLTISLVTTVRIANPMCTEQGAVKFAKQAPLVLLEDGAQRTVGVHAPKDLLDLIAAFANPDYMDLSANIPAPQNSHIRAREDVTCLDLFFACLKGVA
jgi:hypothetical protein